MVGLSALGVQAARAGHSVLTSNTIQVAATQRLAFGRLLNDLDPGSVETVSFTTNGSALATGTNVISVGGTVQPAAFTLSASDSDMAGQSITVSVTAYVDGGTGTDTLPWRWLKADYGGTKTARTSATAGGSLVTTLTDVSIPTTGSTLRVFGGIEVDGDDASGSYTGTVTVTSNHQ